jgi:hypothetical protein
MSGLIKVEPAPVKAPDWASRLLGAMLRQTTMTVSEERLRIFNLSFLLHAEAVYQKSFHLRTWLTAQDSSIYSTLRVC